MHLLHRPALPAAPNPQARAPTLGVRGVAQAELYKTSTPGLAQAGTKFDQPDLGAEGLNLEVARFFSSSQVGRGADVRAPDASRPIASGPRKPSSRPKSEPDKTEIAQIRPPSAPFRDRFQLAELWGPAVGETQTRHHAESRLPKHTPTPSQKRSAPRGMSANNRRQWGEPPAEEPPRSLKNDAQPGHPARVAIVSVVPELPENRATVVCVRE